MHPFAAAMTGVLGHTGHNLVATAALRAPAGLSRAQVSTAVMGLAADGFTWTNFAADTPRFVGSAQRLLIEGQRTNGVRNPRFEGLVAGTPGTAPSNMFTGLPAGITRTINAAGVEFGLPFWDMRFAGTVTTAGTISVGFAFSTDVVAATAQTWAASVSTRLVAGSFNGTGTRLVFSENTSGGAFVTAGGMNIAAPAGFARHAAVRTLTGGATVERVQPSWAADFALNAVVDFTIRFYAPQIEQAAFVSTPIFPPVGAPAAATRATDVVTATLASLGIGANGACTLLWSGMLPVAGGAGVANQTVCELNDGTTNNRLTMLRQGAGNDITPFRATAGAPLSGAAQTFTPGTPFRAGMSLNGAGRVAISVNGGAVQAVTGGPTSGLTTLTLGGAAFAAGSVFGETAHFRTLPFALPDANLPGAVAALPA